MREKIRLEWPASPLRPMPKLPRAPRKDTVSFRVSSSKTLTTGSFPAAAKRLPEDT